MKKYIVIIVGFSLSINAFFDRRNKSDISRDSDLSIVLVHQGVAKSEDKNEAKESKENIRSLEKAFDSFKDRSYRKIGIEFVTIDLSRNDDFKERYKDELSDKNVHLLFFEKGKLLKKQTVAVKNAQELKKVLNEKLYDEDSKIADIIDDLQEEYEEEQEELAKIRASAVSTIAYDPWWYNRYGWYDSYWYPSFGWGFGWHGHRHCR